MTTKILFDNPYYRGLGWEHLKWMFTNTHGHYIPITWMTFGLDFLIWGMNPLGYHLTNLVLHAVNAGLFYLISLFLLRNVYPKAFDENRLLLQGSALLSTFLFSLHPLRVESVAWITERRDVLAAFFLFLSLLCYLKMTQEPASSPRYRKTLTASLILYALSLFSKASAVTWVAVLGLIDIYPLRRWGGRAGWKAAQVEHVWMEKLCFLFVALPAAWLARQSQVNFSGLVGQVRYSTFQRLAIAFYGTVFYVWKTLLPFSLRPLYELPRTFQATDSLFLWSAAAAVGLTLFFLLLYRQWPAGAVAYGTYFALMAPTSGIILVGPVLAADRFSYFSCLSWAILLGSMPLWVWNTWRERPPYRFIFPTVIGFCLLALAGLGILSWKQTQIWRDSESLWSYTVQKEPQSAIAQNQMGRVYQDAQKLDLAIDHFKKALEIIPDYALAHNNLAVALMGKGEEKDAIRHFLAAVESDPHQAQAHFSLGILLQQQGKLPEAMAHYSQAFATNPHLFSAQMSNQLGLIALNGGHWETAVSYFAHAAYSQPPLARAENNWGVALASRRQFAESIPHFERAMAIDPHLTDARANLKIAQRLAFSDRPQK